MDSVDYIKISNVWEYESNDAIGRYYFKGSSWSMDMINYKINTLNYTLELKSFDNFIIFIISFYDNFPKFIICFRNVGCYFTIEKMRDHIDINYDYESLDNKKPLELPEFSEILHTRKSNIVVHEYNCMNGESDISAYGEKLMRFLLDKLDKPFRGKLIELPNINDVIDFLEEPKELLGKSYIEKILEVVNEEDDLNWYIILNYFVARTRELYLPMIIV